MEIDKIEIVNTVYGLEWLTRDLIGISESRIKNLDQNGLIKVGSIVGNGSILVGKVKLSRHLTFEEEKFAELGLQFIATPFLWKNCFYTYTNNRKSTITNVRLKKIYPLCESFQEYNEWSKKLDIKKVIQEIEIRSMFIE